MHNKILQLVDTALNSIKSKLEDKFHGGYLEKYKLVVEELTRIGEDLSDGEHIEFYYYKEAAFKKNSDYYKYIWR